ncbi:hypothetical protein M2244_002000 [Rhodoferax antarcticus]|nr:hypothetical protein [Rhodoferax antarcticus]
MRGAMDIFNVERAADLASALLEKEQNPVSG